jgi:hypothetical protein
MTNYSKEASELYALLIGIDCYLPNKLPGGGYYPSLHGCVRDINHVEEFLKSRLDLSDEHILKLTASNSGSDKPSESKDKWPTYENMVSHFKKLSTIAKPGDQVYIHYSGHGGRTNTKFPELKGPNGLDESLVPTDIGNSEARYLRDIDIAYLLKEMVDKGLIVTIAFDSCHSGGATRGRNIAAIRGLDIIDTTERPMESLVASDKELADTWSLTQDAKRDINLGSGWLPKSNGYVLLAACRPSESACEYPFEGREINGALTYWLLSSLNELLKGKSYGITYKQLHDRILAKVHSQFANQTPMLEGDGSRVVFGSDHVKPQYAVTVMNVDSDKKQVLLNAGQAHGIKKGAYFDIYPPDTVDFTQFDKRLATAKVVELGSTDSWAEFSILNKATIVQGAQAVLLDPGSVLLIKKVHLVKNDKLPLEINQDAALGKVKNAIEDAKWVELAKENENAEYQVAINCDSEFEIWDCVGQAFENLRPPLRISDPQSPSKLVQRLVHLARYHAIGQLSNCDPNSPVANKLIVELTGMQKEYDPADPPQPQPFENSGDIQSIKVGEWTFLRIRNNLPSGRENDPSRILNIAVLDMQPGWGIKQVYPSGIEPFEPLDPGKEIIIPLQANLPAGYKKGKDTLKVFATIGTTNFRWLELPPLDKTQARSVTTRGGPTNPLEELFAAVTEEAPKMRDVDAATYPSREWVTAQVEIHMHQS